MKEQDELEFWLDDKPFATIGSSFVPNINDIISIRNESYIVISKNFAIDYSDDYLRRHMRCAVTLKKVIK